MSAFNCTRCGACCRMAGSVPELAHLDRGDGACRHLLEQDGEHACAIYDERPKACRVDESVPAAMPVAEWRRRNEEACKVLRLNVYGGA